MVFREIDDYQINGKIFKPTKYTGLLFVIKRLDLETGEQHAVGFTYQYLVHTVKQNLFLISGQY